MVLLLLLSHGLISMLAVLRLNFEIYRGDVRGVQAGDVGGHDSNPEILDLSDTTSSIPTCTTCITFTPLTLLKRWFDTSAQSKAVGNDQMVVVFR